MMSTFEFVQALRRRITEEIEVGKEKLVDNPSERSAGKVKGLQTALAITNEEYQKQSQ